MYTHGDSMNHCDTISLFVDSLVYAFINVFFLRFLVQLLCTLWFCLWVTICLVSMKGQYPPTTIAYDCIWKCVYVLEGEGGCIVNSDIIQWL